MHFVHGQCNGNGWGTIVKYWQCFPNHRVPHQKCTQKLKKDWILPMSTNGVIRKAMYSARFSEPHIQSVCRIMMEPDIP